jgi:hypothetical protein
MLLSVGCGREDKNRAHRQEAACGARRIPYPAILETSGGRKVSRHQSHLVARNSFNNRDI